MGGPLIMDFFGKNYYKIDLITDESLALNEGIFC